jgi:hypothetical protein
LEWISYATRTYDRRLLLAAGDAPVREKGLEHLMRGFDTPGLQLSGQLSGMNDLQSKPLAESWKRLAAATLMATAALLLCAAMVVVLAPLLPHRATMSHAASLSLPSPTNSIRV